MKRLHQLWTLFVYNHIVRYDPYIFHFPAAAGVDGLSSFADFYFKYSQPLFACRVKYDPIYEHDIEELRNGGWIVILESNERGELCYVLYNNMVKERHWQ